jgi:hypothetical protein
VLKGGRGDQSVRGVESNASQLAFAFKNAPALRDSFGDRQNVAGKPRS